MNDSDSRYKPGRQTITLGYTVRLHTSKDHLIVKQVVSQEATHNTGLLPLAQEEEKGSGVWPQKVSADCSSFLLDNLRASEARDIESYLPDLNLAYTLKGQGCVSC